MPKPTPTRYRTTNWSAYNTALRKRGEMLIHGPAGHCAAMSREGIKVLFGLPLRQTSGMVAGLLQQAGLD